MKELKCPSGAILSIHHTPFSDSKKLYQALLREFKKVSISTDNMDMGNLFKDLYCIGFSSDDVEAALWRCLAFCTYNPGPGAQKLTLQTFDKEDARQDYTFVCMEVVKENIDPFLRNLSAQSQDLAKWITG